MTPAGSSQAEHGELHQLAAATAEADKPGAETAAPVEGRAEPERGGAPKLTAAQEWAQAPMLFGRIVGRFFPEVNAIYSIEACEKWGSDMVPIADRYGWTAEKFFAWFGPWFALALSSEALVTPTVLALEARVKAAKAARAKAGEGAPGDAGAPAAT